VSTWSPRLHCPSSVLRSAAFRAFLIVLSTYSDSRLSDPLWDRSRDRIAALICSTGSPCETAYMAYVRSIRVPSPS